MVQGYRAQNNRPAIAATGAVATSLLFISCVDGFLKNTHGNTIFYILKDVTLLVILAGILIAFGVRPWERPTGKWYGLSAWYLYVGYLGAQILNPTLGLGASIAGFRAQVLFSVLFLVGAVCFTSTKRLTKTANVAIFWIFVAASAGVFQSLFPNVWDSLSPGLAGASQKYTAWTGGGVGISMAVARAYGTLVDPAAMGLACMVGFILAAAALSRSRGMSRAWFAFAMVVFAVALQFSGSRQSAAGLGAGLLVFLILSWRHSTMRVPAAISFCVLLLAIPIALRASGGAGVTARLGQQDVSLAASTRARSEAIVLATLPSHPFGLGLGATGAGGRQNGAKGDPRVLAVDNVYWATLYQTGVPGLLAFLLLQGTILVLAIRWSLRAKSVGARSTYIALASIQGALLVSGIYTQGVFTYAPVAQIFWLLSGAVALPGRVEGDVK